MIIIKTESKAHRSSDIQHREQTIA